jgi:hypothetical protein
MQDLWGEPLPQSHKKQKAAHGKLADVTFNPQDCHIYGHTFAPFGMNNEKICTVCGTKAYCPLCTPVKHASDALPLFCTKHTNKGVQA